MENTMRELSFKEVEDVSGGIWPVFAVAAGFGFGGGVAYWIYN